MTRKGAGGIAGPLSPFQGSMFALPPPRHIPCDRCGASVRSAAAAEHVCDDDRRHHYDLFHVRHEVGRFENELSAWLDSPAGRFAQDEAARRRRSP
jgi:hypothetical protein